MRASGSMKGQADACQVASVRVSWRRSFLFGWLAWICVPTINEAADATPQPTTHAPVWLVPRPGCCDCLGGMGQPSCPSQAIADAVLVSGTVMDAEASNSAATNASLRMTNPLHLDTQHCLLVLWENCAACCLENF